SWRRKRSRSSGVRANRANRATWSTSISTGMGQSLPTPTAKVRSDPFDSLEVGGDHHGDGGPFRMPGISLGRDQRQVGSEDLILLQRITIPQDRRGLEAGGGGGYREHDEHCFHLVVCDVLGGGVRPGVEHLDRDFGPTGSGWV